MYVHHEYFIKEKSNFKESIALLVYYKIFWMLVKSLEHLKFDFYFTVSFLKE